MKITLEQLKLAESALTKLLSQDLPIEISYQLRKMAKSVKDELAHFDEERVKLVNKYELTDKEPATVEPAKWQAFLTEIETLLKVVVEIAGDGIEIARLFSTGVKMTAAEMVLLEPFFKAV